MMSSPEPAKDVKVDVKISKETGGAYADIREVIKSELARIKKESSNRNNGSSTDSHSRGTNSK